jgi:uncharacterized protein YecE (DUF72 family)
MTVRVGTSGFAYREWKPAFYPADLPSKNFLPYYAERFPTVEINGSFYRMPTAEGVAKWDAPAGPDFRFAFKAPQLITHIKRLKNVKKDVDAFAAAVRVLKKKLGPLLFQLPPFQKIDVPLLADFLPQLPDVRCAFEFRHPSWFVDEVFDLLKKKRVAFCVNDADVEDCPFVSTAPWGYLRLRRVTYTPKEIRTWATTIARAGWRDAFVYFKHEETASGPRNAAALIAALAAESA